MSLELHFGDAREHIKTLADRSVDLILTDPPYNLAPYSTGNINMAWRSSFNNDIAAWDMTPFNPEEWAQQFQRVLKPTGTIFAFTSYNLIGEWHRVFDPIYDTFQVLVWHKTNPPPKLRRAGFLNSCEFVMCCWDKGHTWNFTKQNEMHNFFESGICQGKERLRLPDGEPFPAQKPLKVLQHLINLASRPGDVVYDPFCGVGSTGEAAALLNRDFIGLENDPISYELAMGRLGKYMQKVVA